MAAPKRLSGRRLSGNHGGTFNTPKQIAVRGSPISFAAEQIQSRSEEAFTQMNEERAARWRVYPGLGPVAALPLLMLCYLAQNFFRHHLFVVLLENCAG